MSVFSEADMYPPIKRFFTQMGYDVKAEVKGCDVTMVKDGHLLVVEMKKSFNMTLLYQAIDRQKITTQVYVAIPRPKNIRDSNYKNMLYVLKKLDIGLITVAMDSPVKSVQILNFPTPVPGAKSPAKRDAVLNELSGRTIDANVGGSTKTKLMTAFREKSVQIACVLNREGALTAKELVRLHGCDKNAYRIMKSDYYGWFSFLGNARFVLSEEGKAMLGNTAYKELVDYYGAEYSERT